MGRVIGDHGKAFATNFNPEINIRLGLHYLDYLRKIFGPDNETAILAAYNAGPSAVQTWMTPDQPLRMEDISYPETRRFVKRVQTNYRALKFMQRWTPTRKS